MTKGIFITGTGTDVGKTVVSAGIVYALKSKGFNVVYFKGALSGAIEKDGELIPGDTCFVKEFADLKEELNNMTPYIYKTPVSPHLAGRIEGNPIKREVVLKAFNKLRSRYEYIVAEGAGGLIVPLNYQNYYVYNMIKDLNMSAIIVADSGLGTIHNTTATVMCARDLGIEVSGIIMNNFDENNICHKDNKKIIEDICEIPIIATIPKIENMISEKIDFGSMREVFDRVDWINLLDIMKKI